MVEKTQEETLIEMKEDIETFTTEFFGKYNITAKVLYNLNIDKLAALSVSEVENITNKWIRFEVGEMYSVKSKTRISKLIGYRHAMFYYLHEMGYTLTFIGKYFGFNHATVLHGINKIKTFVDIGDNTTLEILLTLHDDFEKANGSVGDIQPLDQGESDS